MARQKGTGFKPEETVPTSTEQTTQEQTTKTPPKSKGSLSLEVLAKASKKRDEQIALLKKERGENVFYHKHGQKGRVTNLKCKDIIRLPKPSEDPLFFQNNSFAYELTRKAQNDGSNGFDKDNNPIDSEWIYGDNLVIQYVKGERSIFAINQSEGPKKAEYFVFSNGSAMLNSKNHETLHRYLTICNGNRDFKYRNVDRQPSFYAENPEKDAEKRIAEIDKAREAESVILDNDLDSLLPLCIYFGIETFGSSKKIIVASLMEKARENPTNFLAVFNDPMTEVKGEYIIAKQLGLVNIINGVMNISGIGAVLNIPHRADELKYVADWFTNDESGRDYLDAIRRKIETMSN